MSPLPRTVQHVTPARVLSFLNKVSTTLVVCVHFLYVTKSVNIDSGLLFVHNLWLDTWVLAFLKGELNAMPFLVLDGTVHMDLVRFAGYGLSYISIHSPYIMIQYS